MSDLQKIANKCSDCAVWSTLKSQGILDNGYGHDFEHRQCAHVEPWTDQQRHEQMSACPNYTTTLKAIAEGLDDE